MTLAFSRDVASLASFWHSNSPNSQTTHCLLRSLNPFTLSMWLVAKLASVWSSVRSTDGLPLQLLYVAVVGETLAWLLLREASPPPYLLGKKCQLAGMEPLTCGMGMRLLLLLLPSLWGCSNSWLDSSAITQTSRSSTSAAMLILGFKGVLGELVAGMVCTLPSGGVVHSSSSRGSRGILILMYGCSLVIMLAPLCSNSGKVMVIGSSFPFRPSR